METKKDSLENIELRSENVQEVLSRPPQKLILWGNSILFVVILLLFVLAYLIKYPDYINSKISIKTGIPTEKITNKTGGEIDTILIKNYQNVKSGDILMIMKSDSNYQDILKLKKQLETYSFEDFPINQTSSFRLGSLQKYYDNYVEYQLNHNSSYHSKKKSYEILKEAIYSWENDHIIQSKTDGLIIFQQYLTKGLTIKKDQEIFYISPKNSDVIGITYIEAFNSGKIHPGTPVIIKINNYPYQEYGLISGKVKNISMIPNDNGRYYVEIELPFGLKTSNGHILSQNSELLGTVEIIIGNKNLLSKIINIKL